MAIIQNPTQESLLDDLTYKSKKQMFSTEVTPEMLEKLTHRQLETISAVQTANQLFNEQDTGLTDISDFMTNLAMQESNIGGDKEWSGSSSPFQIDPIRYQDLQSKSLAGEQTTIDRASLANKLLGLDSRYGKGVDILNLSGKERRDPLIGSLLTRMALANIPESIPVDLTGQAHYWKDYWNTHAKNAKGNPSDFINQVQFYNKMLNVKTYDNTPIK